MAIKAGIDVEANNNIPLCVDLDGTLIATDTLMESALILIKLKPWFIFILPFWILKGKLYFKNQIHKIAVPVYESLPFNDNVLEFLTKEHSKGRKIILATASQSDIAVNVAESLGIFDDIIGSENGINLRAEHKRDRLIKLFGEKGFDYMGDSKADIPVFEKSRFAYLVNPKKKILDQANKFGNVKHVFKNKSNKIKLLIKEIRVYQWVKNTLIFLPVLMAHKTPDFSLITQLLIAFFSFGFIASSVYVVNDLLDLNSDRSHPRKCRRPFASGQLPLTIGFTLAPMLLLLGFGLSAAFLNWQFNAVIWSYFGLTTAYSFLLKRIHIFDIIILSMLYTIRLFAGAVVAGVPSSPWLMAFSMFIFFSLAVVKRYTELLVMKQENRTKTAGRGYLTSDADLLLSIGTTSGLLSVLVFALYINSKEITFLYKNPHLLYLVAPLLLFGILRIWFKAHRGEMNDDPIVFAGKDPASYIIGAIIFIIVLGASL